MENLMLNLAILSALLIAIGAVRFFIACRNYRARRAAFDQQLSQGFIERRSTPRPVGSYVWTTAARASLLSNS